MTTLNKQKQMFDWLKIPRHEFVSLNCENEKRFSFFYHLPGVLSNRNASRIITIRIVYEYLPIAYMQIHTMTVV